MSLAGSPRVLVSVGGGDDCARGGDTPFSPTGTEGQGP